MVLLCRFKREIRTLKLQKRSIVVRLYEVALFRFSLAIFFVCLFESLCLCDKFCLRFLSLLKSSGLTKVDGGVFFVDK